MSSTRVATIGELVLDQVVVEGRQSTHSQLGGGAIYSAVGARIWGASPEVFAVAGSDVAEPDLERLTDAGIGLGSLTHIEGPSLGLWLLYEQSGRRQQVQKLDSPTMLAVDLARSNPRPADRFDGLHVAPQTTEGQFRALGGDADVKTLDCMVEEYIELAPYRDGRAFVGITAFLPSVHEVERIWGRIDPVQLARMLNDLAGVRWTVITDGADGAIIAAVDGVRRVPALPVESVDPTGAGDAFAGGFLVGLLETGDPIQAASAGAVSASFVVETRGPHEALRAATMRERDRRMAKLSRDDTFSSAAIR